MADSQYQFLGPLPSPPLPLLTGILYYIKLQLMQWATKLTFTIQRTFRPLPRSQLPTITKSYPANPHLTHRIFYPPSYKPGYDKLPLFIDIHGGGFALCDPAFDDEVNAPLAAANHCIVISLDYSKAPAARFPTAQRELVSTVNSILNDISLQFDRERVVIGGYSAGGNLSLSVVQSRSLKGKIHGVVAWYPVTDFSTTTEHKLTTRSYAAGEVDMLASNGSLFNYAYIPVDQDLRDPLLSPSFAKRNVMPEWICMVGAEKDMLCNEAGVLIGTYAGIDVAGDWNTQGGKGSAGLKDGFESHGGKEKWLLVRGAKHGFTHYMFEGGEAERLRKESADMVAREVGRWLNKGPFSEKEVGRK